MSDETLLFWGGIVTMFLILAFLLTLRQVFENRMSEREERLRKEREIVETAESNSGL
jgi:hypothetical protein